MTLLAMFMQYYIKAKCGTNVLFLKAYILKWILCPPRLINDSDGSRLPTWNEVCSQLVSNLNNFLSSLNKHVAIITTARRKLPL